MKQAYLSLFSSVMHRGLRSAKRSKAEPLTVQNPEVVET